MKNPAKTFQVFIAANATGWSSGFSRSQRDSGKGDRVKRGRHHSPSTFHFPLFTFSPSGSCLLNSEYRSGYDG